MRTLTLKTDDSFFDKVTMLSEHLHLSKSELIRRAIVAYEETMKRQEMKEQMRSASLRVRQASRESADEFDVTLVDGLEDA